jgi:hypothetical protein
MALTRELVDLFLAELARRGLPAPERQADGSFRLDVGELELVISLDNLARDFAEDRDPARVAHFVEQVAAHCTAAVVPDWPTAEVGLRFKAEPSTYNFGEAIRESISDSLCRVLVYTSPEERAIQWVMPWMLEQWGKTREEAEEVARRNMARLLTETEFHVEEHEEGRLGYFKGNSAFKASLLFSPNLKEVLAPRVGWPLLVVIPNRDFAYVFPEQDRDLFPAIGSIVVEQYRTGGYPISTEVFLVADDGIAAIGRFEAPPEEELRAGRDAEEGLKTINYRGGIVRFRIPASWEEEDDEEQGGTFHDEEEPGILRLTVLTIATKGKNPAASTERLLQQRSEEQGVQLQRLDNGNALIHYRKEIEEEDEPLTIWYWEILGLLPPRHARLAVFSFTVEREEANDEDIQELVATLNRELERCEFGQELSE